MESGQYTPFACEKLVDFVEALLKDFESKKALTSLLALETTQNFVHDMDPHLGLEEVHKGVVEPLEYMFKMKSKRMRVILAAITGFEFDLKEFDTYQVGAFVEVLHNASLIIDDIEDNSSKRRGVPCCHIQFGVPVAINSANTVYFSAMSWILKIQDERIRGKLLEISVSELTRLHLGQNQDIVWNRDLLGGSQQYTEAGYFTLCKHKTSGLLRIVSRCCAVLSPNQIDPSRLEELNKLYDNIGILFQIVDDILNLEESTVASNKHHRGEDIREGNKTIITIHALNHAGVERQLVDYEECEHKPNKSKESLRLNEILLMKTSDQTIIDEAIDICEKAGSIAHARNVVNDLRLKLTEEVDLVFTKPYTQGLMKQLVDMIAHRKH